MKRITFFIILLFLFAGFVYGQDSDCLQENEYLDFEIEYNGKFESCNIFKISEGNQIFIKKIDNIEEAKLSFNKQNLYCLKAGDYYTPLYKFIGEECKSIYLGDFTSAFRVSRDEKYIIDYKYTKNLAVEDIRIINIETKEQVFYLKSLDVILKLYPGIDDPEQYGLTMYDNYEANGIDIVYNQWWEAGPQTFTIFISFDDFSCKYTDRKDLIPELR